MLTNISTRKVEVKSKNTGWIAGIFLQTLWQKAKKNLQFIKNMLLVGHNIIESGVKNPAFLLEGTKHAPDSPFANSAWTDC